MPLPTAQPHRTPLHYYNSLSSVSSVVCSRVTFEHVESSTLDKIRFEIANQQKSAGRQAVKKESQLETNVLLNLNPNEYRVPAACYTCAERFACDFNTEKPIGNTPIEDTCYCCLLRLPPTPSLLLTRVPCKLLFLERPPLPQLRLLPLLSRCCCCCLISFRWDARPMQLVPSP